jgi:hypothetical protein
VVQQPLGLFASAIHVDRRREFLAAQRRHCTTHAGLMPGWVIKNFVRPGQPSAAPVDVLYDAKGIGRSPTTKALPASRVPRTSAPRKFRGSTRKRPWRRTGPSTGRASLARSCCGSGPTPPRRWTGSGGLRRVAEDDGPFHLRRRRQGS